MDEILFFRISFGLIFLSAVSVSGYFRYQARKGGKQIARREEGTAAVIARLLLTLPLIFSITIYLFFPGFLPGLYLDLPVLVRYIGVALGISCIPFIYAVFQNIGKNISETVLTKTDQELIETGPYKHIRHPLYAAGLLEILTMGLISANWLIFVFVLVVFIIFRFFVIPKEERHLIEKFGEQYENYKKTTGALFPRIF